MTDVDNTKEFTVIEFCAGYSGISLGLKRAIPNLRVVAVSEIEAFAVANLVSKMEAGLLDPAPVWPDLKTFPGERFRGKVDCLVAGFPCQPFSSAGKRGADDDPRHLFPYIKRSIGVIQPRTVFLENVEGIISSKLKGDGWADPEGTYVLLHVLRELERLGYRATAGVFSAAEVGAPHQRKRVFIYAELANEQRKGLQGYPRNGDRGGEPGWVEAQARRPACEGSLWPSRPGEQQHDWEPPRVVGNTEHDGHSAAENRRGISEKQEKGWVQKLTRGREQTADDKEAQPSVGGNSDGPADRVDNAKLYVSCDNRVDELRLLGNGVVPATAEKAWRVLSGRF